MEGRPPAVTFDVEVASQPVGPGVWRDLGCGVWVKVRPETGLLAASIQAQISRELYAFHAGQDVLGRYGFSADDVGLLAEANVATGFAVMLDAIIRGAALIEDWNLADVAGAPVPIETASLKALFDQGVVPGTGGVLMAAFRRICDEPALKRAQEGNGSAPSPNGATAGAPTSAGDAAPKGSPAPTEASAKTAAAALSEKKPRRPRKAARP